MKQRITVGDFYKKIVPVPAVEVATLQAFITPTSFFAMTAKPTQLLKYSLQHPENCTPIPLPQQLAQASEIYLRTLDEMDNLLLYSLRGQSTLYCFAFREKKTTAIELAHFSPITATCRMLESFYSASQDLTIRVWDILHQGLVPHRARHLLTGHAGTINCLRVHEDLLLSGSTDRSLIVWQAKKQLTRKQFPQSIQNLFCCQESNQLCLVQQDQTISILDLEILKKQRKLVVNRQIKGVTIPKVLGVCEIDESFILLWGEGGLEVVQINLGEAVGRVETGGVGKFVAARAIRRLMLVGATEGLFLLKV